MFGALEAIMFGRAIGIGMLGATVVLLAGCATNRSEILPANPMTALATKPPTKGRTILIRSVSDDRVFAEQSKDPSVPTLGSGGAAHATGEVKARAIGRKRNTFGQPMGDILLERSATVADIVQENVTAALTEAGYKVTTNTADAGERPLVVDVRVKQFWEWFEPGFWALTLHVNIETNLEGLDLREALVANVSTKHSYQAASDDSWLEVLEEGLREYRGRLTALSSNLPP